MKIFASLAVVLAVLFVAGCADDDEFAPAENVVSTDVAPPGNGQLIEDVAVSCPIRIDLPEMGFDINPTDVEYNSSGQVVSASFDYDQDGVVDTLCSYGYDAKRRLMVVTADFGADGEPDGWIYLEDFRGQIGDRRDW